MKILGSRILVSKVEEEKKDGFQAVEVQDSFVNKGKIEQIGVPNMPDSSIAMTVPSNAGVNHRLYNVGDIVLFAKYSPDTQEIEHEGQKLKVVKVEDVIAVL